MELTAQGAGIAGGVPGFVIEDDLSEGAVQDDLGGDRRHGGIGQHVAGGVDPLRSGHRVVVEQPDDLAPGMTQAQVNAPCKPQVDRGADHLGVHGPGDDRGLVALGPVVDHHDLVGLCHRRGQARGEPVSRTVRDDDHRGVRWHQRVATTFP